MKIQEAIKALKAGKRVTLDGKEVKINGLYIRGAAAGIDGSILSNDDLLREDYEVVREYFRFEEAMRRMSAGAVVACDIYGGVYKFRDGMPVHADNSGETYFLLGETQSDRWYEVKR